MRQLKFIVWNKERPSISHLIAKYYPALTTILARMDPSICWEKDGTISETVNHNLHQVELLVMKTADDNSPRAAKIRLDCEVSGIFNKRWMVRWLGQPTPDSSLCTLLPSLSS